MKRLSISLRLTLWYAAVSAVGLVIFGVVMWFVLASSMLSWKDRTLQMRAARVEGALRSSSLDTPDTLNEKLESVTGSLPEGEWIRIVHADGQPVFPRGRSSIVSLSAIPCKAALFRDQMVNRQRFRELCHPVFYRKEAAFLLVLSPLTEDRILLSNFISGLYRIIPILLLVSGFGGYLLSRRALAPVDVIISEASAITANDLSRRLSLSTADDQLRRLALEWNSLLARIETAVIRITQFTADASHELRSPIAFIQTAAEYQLGNPALDEEQREVFMAILQETNATTEMLESLLLLARLDAEGMPPLSQPVNVYQIAAEVVIQFEPASRKFHQQLIAALPPSTPSLVRMAPGHLRRVLVAVIDNAIKYTPEGGQIRLEFDSSEGLSLYIKDTGYGIAAEHLDRIFDRFYRADQARTNTKEGVGLGLTIARRLMEQYGARISVESQLGKGTVVALAFPDYLIWSADVIG